jgi:glycosyltransferase involved in cell wall biosynthesis
MTQGTLSVPGVVIPCYNEEHRFDVDRILELLDNDPQLRLFLVDDGSRDRTRDVLEGLRMRFPKRVHVVVLEVNQGKGEAVRQGLRRALDAGCDIVAYLDADLSTPPAELLRLLSVMRATGCAVLVAARVGLLGRGIERTTARHYLGRLFATAASLALGLHVYDTQCGAKLFRRHRALEHAVATPFHSRWAFDVELLARLARGPNALAPDAIREEPLMVWRDVPGSKLKAGHMAQAAIDLLAIAWRVRHPK